MHIVIRNYHSETPELVAAAVARQESLKKTMGGIKGLIAYYIVDTGDGGLASVSVFEDQAGAEASIAVAAAWVREHMAQWASSPPQIIQGEVAINIP